MKAKSPWALIYDHFKPEDERLRETLCTLGNGYFGTRGAAPESMESEIHYPGTYIAGLFNKLPSMINGKKIFNEDFINCPNWLPITFRTGEGRWFSPINVKILDFHQELNLKTGILQRKIKFQDSDGRITLLEDERIAHMGNPHLGAIRYVITPLNYNDWIVVKSEIDGSVTNAGVERYRKLNNDHLHDHFISFPFKGGFFLKTKTTQSNVEIMMASKIKALINQKHISPFFQPFVGKKGQKGGFEFRTFLKEKHSLTIEKFVSIFTSKDLDSKNPEKEAIELALSIKSFQNIKKSQSKVWQDIWKRFDVHLEGDPFSQKVLRFNIFHLLQTASHHNLNIDAGLPARGLHGEAYRGHIFWDEIYVLHLYDFNFPEITKAILKYRHKRLPMARKYAKDNGFKGAMFPWQSSSTGEEETQIMHLNPLSGKWGPDHSCLQRHISFAIAYNVLKYFQRTKDKTFFKNMGAEILLSIAHFAASLCTFSNKDKRYHTQNLMGPDEFHEKLPGSKKGGLRDNSYSNFMIAWILMKSTELIKIIPEKAKDKLLKKMGISKNEIKRWEEISRNMKIIIDKNGIISQFDGYFDLKELNWKFYRKKYKNIQRLDRILKAEGKSPDAYKVAKQADVLMIFYLFPEEEVKEIFERLRYEYKEKMLKLNYDYYLKRTSHGSTLSKVVHCYLSQKLGMEKEAWKWYLEVIKSDTHDTQGGTTPEGIHCGVMGGSVDIVTRAFAGIEILDNKIKISPNLPKESKLLKFNFMFRGTVISVDMTHSFLKLSLSGIKTKKLNIPFEIKSELHYLLPGNEYRFKI